MSAFAHTKTNKSRIAKPVSAKLAVLKEHDLRRFLLVKGVEKKLLVVKELVVQQALAQLKAKQTATVNLGMGINKLVIQDVVQVGVEMQFGPGDGYKKQHAGALPAQPRPPTPAHAQLNLDAGSIESSQRFRQAFGAEERIMAGHPAQSRINLNDDEGEAANNTLQSSSSAVVDVGKQRFVRAFGAPEQEMSSLSMGSESSMQDRTLTNDSTSTDGTTQRFAAGHAAAAARAAEPQSAALLYGHGQRLLCATLDTETQQDQTDAGSESWHHWQASVESSKSCFKPDAPKEVKKDDAELQLQEALHLCAIVVEAMQTAVALREAACALLLSSCGSEQREEEKLQEAEKRCALVC